MTLGLSPEETQAAPELVNRAEVNSEIDDAALIIECEVTSAEVHARLVDHWIGKQLSPEDMIDTLKSILRAEGRPRDECTARNVLAYGEDLYWKSIRIPNESKPEEPDWLWEILE